MIGGKERKAAVYLVEYLGTGISRVRGWIDRSSGSGRQHAICDAPEWNICPAVSAADAVHGTHGELD